MRLFFIRHAEAVEADRFDGDDGLRPLTRAGRKKAAAAYRRLTRILPEPEWIASSEAVRAIQTADLLHKYARRAKRKITPLLNPGRGIRGFRALYAAVPKTCRVAVFVGHEPDLSQIISSIVSGGKLNMQMKKGACADVEAGPGGHGLLRALLTLDAMKGGR